MAFRLWGGMIVLMLLPWVAAASERPDPNILLICWDTVRQSDISAYGYCRPTTPHLDRLAEEGWRFDRAIASSSWTKPSVASVFTGLEPWQHGATRLDNGIRPEVPTLAEHLAALGYRTQAVVSHPTVIGSSYGFNRGFEHYDDLTVDARRVQEQLNRPPFKDDPHRGITGDVVTETARRYLHKRGAVPFFLFLHYFDPHAEYESHPDIESELVQGATDCDGEGRAMGKDNGRLRYDAEISWTDQQLGTIMGILADEGLSKNTVVIVFSDHGEEFGEHGGTGHGRTLFPEVLRVPLVVWGAGIEPLEITGLFSLTDLHDLILDAARGELAPPSAATAVAASLYLRDPLFAHITPDRWFVQSIDQSRATVFDWQGRQQRQATESIITEAMLMPSEQGRGLSREQTLKLKALGYLGETRDR